VFTKDNNGNYSATGVIPSGSPFTPAATTFTITSSAGVNGTIVPSGATVVAQASFVNGFHDFFVATVSWI